MSDVMPLQLSISPYSSGHLVLHELHGIQGSIKVLKVPQLGCAGWYGGHAALTVMHAAAASCTDADERDEQSSGSPEPISAADGEGMCPA